MVVGLGVSRTEAITRRRQFGSSAIRSAKKITEELFDAQDIAC
jgi:hypothetical protein